MARHNWPEKINFSSVQSIYYLAITHPAINDNFSIVTAKELPTARGRAHGEHVLHKDKNLRNYRFLAFRHPPRIQTHLVTDAAAAALTAPTHLHASSQSHHHHRRRPFRDTRTHDAHTRTAKDPQNVSQLKMHFLSAAAMIEKFSLWFFILCLKRISLPHLDPAVFPEQKKTFHFSSPSLRFPIKKYGVIIHSVHIVPFWLSKTLATKLCVFHDLRCCSNPIKL